MSPGLPHRVIVVGSITADVTAFNSRLPQPGETLLGESFNLVLGGKGANQALAAAMAGAGTSMIGCVGQDLFRDMVLQGLRDGGVDITAVEEVAGPTGVAHIRVNSATGQNDIVIVPLANSHATPELVERNLRAIGDPGDVLLLQLEIPVETAVHAARLANTLGMRVVLDPAPATALPDELWPLVDVVTPNESEAEVLTGITVSDTESAVEAGQWFVCRGVTTALITLAEKGVVESNGRDIRHTPAPSVDVVDTTAAGDAFTGHLGAGMATGLPWESSVQRAVYAGALAVTKRGASPSLPTSDEVTAFMDNSPDTRR